MRVLIVNTSESAGGAAVAAKRLMNALISHGVKAKMLVRDKQSDDPNVSPLPHYTLQHLRFLWERWRIFVSLHFNRERLFDIDTAYCGADITSTPEFREADVIHLHWVNQGMLSLKGVRKILDSGKPVVWTLHDAWPATGICHLTFDCQRFKSQCANCPLLPGKGSDNDLANAVWRRKQRVYQQGNIHFVACSRWLEGEARQSALLKNMNVTSIPNPIDTHVYRPGDGGERQRLGLPEKKRLILFVSQRATNPYKGMDYLEKACQIMAEEHPEMRTDTALLVMGGHAEELQANADLPFEVIPLGYVNDEQRKVDFYRAADVFVLPSLSENLPNTIMEAMACGTPAVAFRVGGVTEEIDHLKNGYVAQYRSAEDLARGLHWTLCEANREALRQACVDKVRHRWSQHQVALQYIELYNEALAMKHYL